MWRAYGKLVWAAIAVEFYIMNVLFLKTSILTILHVWVFCVFFFSKSCLCSFVKNVHWIKLETLLSSTQSYHVILNIFTKKDVGQLIYVLIGKIFFLQFVVTCCITFRVTFLRTQKMTVLTCMTFPPSPESPCCQQIVTDEQGEVCSSRLIHWHLQYLLFMRAFFGHSLQRISLPCTFPISSDTWTNICSITWHSTP